MSIWLDAGVASAGLNMALLAGLGAVWVRNYRRHHASHTLGLLVFGSFLAIQNALWLVFYGLHPAFIGWYINTTPDVQIGMTALCGLETIALLAMFRITWR